MNEANVLTDYYRLLDMDDSDFPLTVGEEKEVQEYLRRYMTETLNSMEEQVLDTCLGLARSSNFKAQVMARKLEELRHLMYEACIRIVNERLSTESPQGLG